MDTAPRLFTLAQIAAPLGLTVAGVQKRLRAVPPCGRALVRGQQALAWTVEGLPEAMRDELAELARRGQYRDTAHLLSDPARGWRPAIDGQPVTLGQVAESDVVEATKLQRALLPSLARITANPPVPAAEATARGLAEWKAEFGHAVSAAHWRRLVNRTVERAGSGTDYPIEIFLPARLTRRTATGQPVGAPGAGNLHDLCRAFSHVKKPSEPTAQEEAFVWDTAFAELAGLVAGEMEERKARRLVFHALKYSGLRLAKSAPALEMAFSRKLARWQAGDCRPAALLDRRAGPRDAARVPLPEADRLAIIGHSVGAGGRVSQGYREALAAGKLSAETTARTVSWPASKSYVPRRIRNAVKDDVAALEDIHHGPRRAKLNGAWIPRDYSDIGPGDVFQADDVTMPIAYWEQTPEGPVAMRGQLLLFVDVATSLILGFCLHSERNYNAALIRSTFLRVHDVWGLARRSVYFEKGIWKKSRLLTGRPADEITLAETEMGLREFVQFRHADLPRGKVVENIIGKLQDMVEPEVGYLGRNEQVEKFERIQKKLLEAARGKIPFGSFLYDKAEWTGKLDGYCRTYNATRQDGRLKGLSPMEAYETGFDYRNPMVRLDGCTRYLLTNHRRQEKISKNGIRLLWHGEPFYYRSEATSPLRGKQVLVWFDVEACPESVTITDLDRRNAIEVPRVTPLPSFTASREQLSAAHAQAAAHGSHQKTLYRIIKPHLKGQMFRRTQADLNTAMLGDAIEEGRAKVRAKQDERNQTAQRTAALERELGLAASQPGRDAASRLQSLRLQKEAEALEAQERENER